MPIATRTTDPMLSAAPIAFVQDSAQLARSATRDRTDHLAMHERHSLAELLDVSRCVLPQAVRNRSHRLVFVRPASKELLDRLPRVDFGDLGQMQIDHCRLQAAVAQVLLNDSQAEPRFEQVSGVRMSQRVDRDFLAEVDLLRDQLHRTLGRRGAHGRIGSRHAGVLAAISGEQEQAVSMRSPIQTKPMKRRRW